jgi:5-methylthioadenosine/S-adenosylhomocysteine deaminase
MEWEERIAFARGWPALHNSLGGPQTPLFFMPHSVYTDSEAHLKEVAELAKEFGARIHLHVSETEVENAMSLKTHGRSPTQVILDAGILDVPTTYGHGVYLSDEDVLTSAKKNASVAHCPGSNLKLGNGIANIRSYQGAGMAVGLGPDSCSSSNDLDMWSVVRLTAQLVTFTHKPEDLDLSMIIRAATIEGARAIGLSDVIGSIEIGKEADLIAIDLNALHLTPIHNVLALLVFAAGRSDVSDVWVAGEMVVKDRQLTKINVNDLRERVLRRVSALDSIR